MTIQKTTLITYLSFALFGLATLNACNSGTEKSPESSEPQIGAAISADFVAVRVEGENYNNLTGGWTLTSQANIPSITPDPDPPHFSTASGGAYVELLPDTRVTHNDRLQNGVNFWGSPENSPRLEYNIDIPEPGRYYVFVKAHSTGTEDNGIHVGINGQTPESGHRLQFCGGKNRWTWSSAQRADTNHCGVTKTIFLDIDTAGSHNIIFYAREDGFELDQFILIKDINEGIVDCAPVPSDIIQCVDVASGENTGRYDLDTTPTNDGNKVIFEPPVSPTIVDLQLSLSSNQESLSLAEEVRFTLQIGNLDDSDTATNVQALITLPDGLDFISSDICNSTTNQLTCTFPEITPNEQVDATFTAVATMPASLRVDAQVSAEQQETTLGNNMDSVVVIASISIPQFDGALSINQGPNALGLNDQTTHLVTISNKGQQEINDSVLEITTAASAVTVSSTNSDCSGEPVLSCQTESIQPGDSISIPVTLSGANAGADDVAIRLSVDSDEDTSNNVLNTTVHVIKSNTITDFNGVLILEAESFVRQETPNDSPIQGAYNSAWFVTSSWLTPNISPDFDSVSAEATSNSSYVEFLPDTRVGEADPIELNVSNYQGGGDSAVLTYNVFFNAAGRYYTAALMRANNTQDASIYIGYNGQWPESSENLSVCRPDGEWQWTNNTDCGTDKTAYVDIPTPGTHTIQLSAATDGVELDKIFLALDTTELPSGIAGTPQIYSPSDIDLNVAENNESTTPFTANAIADTDSNGGGLFDFRLLLMLSLLYSWGLLLSKPARSYQY